MADRFFDTSAFAKHYRAELGTAKVDAFLAETGSRHFISALGVVELHSVLARLARVGQIAAADFHLARGRFLDDLARFFVVTDRLPGAYAEMATDSDREAEAVEWLGALPVGTPLDEA